MNAGRTYHFRERRKPKTPIPQTPGKNFYTALDDEHAKAAINCRLPALTMTDLEQESFPDYRTPRTNRKVYLRTRNYICAQWLKTPTERLTLDSLLTSLRNNEIVGVKDDEVVTDAYMFLDRHRHINFGLIPEGKKEDRKEGVSRRPKIVVIGAGIAGVTVARELGNIYGNCDGAVMPEIIILEGRKRVGGRIFTFPLHTKAKGSNTGAGVDLAAQIITGFEGGNPLAPIMKSQLSLPIYHLHSGPDHCPLYDHDGSPVPPQSDTFTNTLFNSILDSACNTIIHNGVPAVITKGKRIRQDPNPDGTSPSLGQMFDYHMERHEQWKGLGAQEVRLVQWHLANLEFANAARLDRTSLQHWDQDDGFEFGGDHAMVKGGYGQLPHAYAFTGTPLDIRFGKVAETISVLPVEESTNEAEVPKGMVKIGCRDGSEFECDAVVVTVPLGVLKNRQVTFDPPLPIWKQTAINNLEMGLFNKLVLVFPRMFWDPKADMFGSLANPVEVGKHKIAGTPDNVKDLSGYAAARGRFFLFWNLYPVTKTPVLVAFISGEAAREMEKESDMTVVKKAMEILAGIFREKGEASVPPPVETIVTRWSRDEFARGSYSYIAKDATGADYDNLAKTVGGKIFWAGEATCRSYPATVHGALLSGFRVASSISDALLGPIQHIADKRKQTPSTTKSPPNTTLCPRGCGHILSQTESIFDHLNTHTKAEAQRAVSLASRIETSPDSTGVASPSATTSNHAKSPTPDGGPAKKRRLDNNEGAEEEVEEIPHIPSAPTGGRKRKEPKSRESPIDGFGLFQQEKTEALKKYMEDNGLVGIAEYNTLVVAWWGQIPVEEKKEYERKEKEQRRKERGMRTSPRAAGRTPQPRSATWFKEGAFKESESDWVSSEEEEGQ
ncbi:hypothetical protein HK097_007926 [Rhizophlyctis rosea]|uniref:SWIRM domain-containing protein n=1 Tax=Rhizophlyctis rosea TaxID=64517 RepID=A0AAD5SAY1_9FUNG|nr:hypothetical protein HK097_007926 [Rhizophlyctis rosea]